MYPIDRNVIWICDDEPQDLENLASHITGGQNQPPELCAGLEVVQFSQFEDILIAIRDPESKCPAVAFVDLQDKATGLFLGFDVIDSLNEKWEHLPIIAWTWQYTMTTLAIIAGKKNAP